MRLPGVPSAFYVRPVGQLRWRNLQPVTQNDGYVFRVQSRWTELANLSFNGESNVEANYKGFFENTCVAGQYFRATNINWKNVNGRCLSLLDTLDTRIDQVYASNCNGGVIYATWTNTAAGSWYHITAIELSNFNFQSCRGEKMVIDLQRAGQSIMRNGWIEHCENPGNISNGQWLIDAMSMEACTNGMLCQYARILWRQNNVQGQSKWDDTRGGGSRWLSYWEMGTCETQNHGMKMTGSFSAGYVTHTDKLDNNTESEQWYKLGSCFIPNVGDTVKIRVFGTRAFNSIGILNAVNAHSQSGGEAEIYIQRKANGSPQVQWTGTGSCPVTAVKFTSAWPSDCILYIKVGSWTRNLITFCETNAKTRYETGSPFYFKREMLLMTPEQIDAQQGMQDADEAFTLGVHHGIGFNQEGVMLIKGATDGKGHLRVMVNGQPFFIELKK